MYCLQYLHEYCRRTTNMTTICACCCPHNYCQCRLCSIFVFGFTVVHNWVYTKYGFNKAKQLAAVDSLIDILLLCVVILLVAIWTHV